MPKPGEQNNVIEEAAPEEQNELEEQKAVEEQKIEAPEEVKEDKKEEQEEKKTDEPTSSGLSPSQKINRKRARMQQKKQYQMEQEEEERKRKKEEEEEKERQERAAKEAMLKEEQEAKQKEEEERKEEERIREQSKRQLIIDEKRKNARSVHPERVHQREVLAEKWQNYDVPYDSKTWQEARKKYISLSKEWNIYADDGVELNDFLKKVQDNYARVKKNPKAFREDMFDSLYEVHTFFKMDRRSKYKTRGVFEASVEELHVLLNASIDVLQDDLSYYNCMQHADEYYTDVFDEIYADHKHLLNGRFDRELEKSDKQREREAEEARKQQELKAQQEAEEAGKKQEDKVQKAVEEDRQQNELKPADQALAEPQRDELDDAFESFDVASRQFLWGGSGHRAEFEAIRTAIREFKNETDIYLKDKHARELYCACRVYLDKHTDNGRRQSDIGGQKQAGGRMRKQAVVNILRILDEKCSKTTDRDEIFNSIQSEYNVYCEKRNIPVVKTDYAALERSLANETCKEIRNSQFSIHEKAYKELQIATEAFRTKRAQKEAKHSAGGKKQAKLKPDNNQLNQAK